MKLRGLLVAAAVLAALSGVLYWSNHRKPAEDTAKASADAPPKILSLNEGDVTAVVIRKKGQPAVTLAKNNGTWQLTAPRTLATDAALVSGVVSTLSSLTAERMVDDKASDLAQYGLADPALEVEVTAKSKTQRLWVGNATINSGANYAAVGGDPRVFTIPSYTRASLDKGVGELRDTRLLTVDFDKVTQIELTTQTAKKKQDITFARDKDSWQILKPRPIRADSFQVDGLIRSLRDAKLDAPSSEDEKKNSAAFNAGTPFATVKVSGAAGTQELQVRKNKDDYYARSSVVEGSFKIASGIATGLDKSLDDFRNKKLLDLGFSDPDKVEIHDGTKAYFLTHSGSDWWDGNGKKLDSATVEPLVEKLHDLSATKFPDAGFTAPSIEIKVVSNSGKTTDKVGIAKSGDSYVAKREGEPGLYELSAASVTGIQGAAGGLKAAPPPAPAAAKKK